MFRLFSILTVAAWLSACVSTFANQYVGRSFEEIQLAEGPPLNSLDLADGRKALQYAWGGGQVFTSHSSPGPVVTTTGIAASNQGCVVSFIGVESNGHWIVEEVRYPDRMFC